MKSSNVIKTLRPNGWVLPLLIAFSAVLAWFNRFVQDDAFISFRYARHLAEGHGLVWNIGERVEGYTNFLWVVCLTPATWLGCDIVYYSYVLSLAAFICTLVFAYELALFLWRDRRAGYLAVLLLGTNYSFSSYATGGLETQFVTAWTLGAVWLLARWSKEGTAGGLMGAAFASACAAMTRMDSIVLLAPFWLSVIIAVLRAKNKRQTVLLTLAICLAALPLAGWVLWRYRYYDAWVPNTFLIKSTGSSWFRGLYYAGLFYFLYGFWLLVPFCWPVWRRKGNSPFFFSSAISWICWQCYVVFIGGDFMEFRMMMPSFPFLAVALAGVGLLEHPRPSFMRCAVLVSLLLFSCAHGISQRCYPCIDSVNKLKRQVVEWKEVAEILNAALGADKQSVKIGVTCAGVIPFYTMMPTLDLLGLNDLDVAKRGDRIRVANQWIGNRPGHARMASWSQVLGKEVHLLINTPWIMEIPESELKTWRRSEVVRGSFWRGVDESAGAVRFPEKGYDIPKVIAWPCGTERYLITVYTKASPVVDEAIRRTGAVVLSE